MFGNNNPAIDASNWIAQVHKSFADLLTSLDKLRRVYKPCDDWCITQAKVMGAHPDFVLPRYNLVHVDNEAKIKKEMSPAEWDGFLKAHTKR